MFINPRIAIQEGWIKFPSWMLAPEVCIQPNAIDFTLDRVFSISPSRPFILSEDTKQHRFTEELTLMNVQQIDGSDDFFQICTGSYDVMSDFYVNVPDGVACQLIIRSTANRNGLFLTSGLYDAGFQGNIGCVLHNTGPVAWIAPHTRIGQIIFVESATSGQMYAGQYNTTNGAHWSSTQQG